MRLFEKTIKPQKRPHRRTTPWLEKTAKNSEELLTQAKDLPLLQAAIISKRTGVQIGVEDLKPISAKEAFKSEAMKMAIEKLKTDPEYKEEVAEEAKMLLSEEIEGSRGRRYGRSRGSQDYDDREGMIPYQPLGPIDIIQQYHQIAENFPKNGGLSNILQPEVLLGFLDFAKTMMGPKNLPNNNNSRGVDVVMVEVDGQLVEMTRAGYTIYKRQRDELLKLKPAVPAIASTSTEGPTPASTGTVTPEVRNHAITTPEAVTVTQGTVQVETPPADIGEKPQLPVPMEVLLEMAGTITPYFDGTPAAWVKDLREQAKTDPNVASFAQIFMVMDADTIIKTVKPYAVYPELAPFIKRLEDKKVWVEEAFKLLRESK